MKKFSDALSKRDVIAGNKNNLTSPTTVTFMKVSQHAQLQENKFENKIVQATQSNIRQYISLDIVSWINYEDVSRSNVQ